MVHVKYASIAGGTVMASFRFEDMTNQAVSSFFMFGVIQKETLL
jgi:hypothetical protein